MVQHDFKDAEHIQSIAAVPQIIEESIYFGRGFYFTYQDGSYATAKQAKAEARYYGWNITEAFLNILNPFMFNETLYQFNGKYTWARRKSL